MVTKARQRLLNVLVSKVGDKGCVFYITAYKDVLLLSCYFL